MGSLKRSGFAGDSFPGEDRVMAAKSPYPAELRKRAMRMVAEVRPENPTE
jgi:hypothetical protein